ncbi:hypothetical protein TKK_0004155 [Trichogramma kaykai]
MVRSFESLNECDIYVEGVVLPSNLENKERRIIEVIKAICRSQLNFSDKKTPRVLISSEKGTISPPISSPAGNNGFSEVTKLKLPISMTFVLAALHPKNGGRDSVQAKTLRNAPSHRQPHLVLRYMSKIEHCTPLCRDSNVSHADVEWRRTGANGNVVRAELIGRERCQG